MTGHSATEIPVLSSHSRVPLRVFRLPLRCQRNVYSGTLTQHKLVVTFSDYQSLLQGQSSSRTKSLMFSFLLGLSLPTRWYPKFDVVVGLAWSHDPESNAGGSLATGSVSNAGKVKGDDPEAKGYPGLPGWGWASDRQPHPVKKLCSETLKNPSERADKRNTIWL